VLHPEPLKLPAVWLPGLYHPESDSLAPRVSDHVADDLADHIVAYLVAHWFSHDIISNYIADRLSNHFVTDRPTLQHACAFVQLYHGV
jgi:hypothetical protein